MKQILQNLRTGITEIADVPCPQVGRGQLLIRTQCSLVSAGTERMLVDFGKASLIEKARGQPDKVRMVLNKVKTDGIVPTWEAVRNKLDQPLPMGYCNVGTVLEVGEGVRGFSVGDRVASNGRHAEVVSISENLCAKIPAAVHSECAAFTVISAIALQGIRLVQPTLGETVVVTGLGLIGLITVQLLRAHGCHVIGIDFDRERLTLAESFGANVIDLQANQDPITVAYSLSRGRGVDAVIVTAATSSSLPIHQAAQMCRQRGRIVLVGVTGLELSRADFYEKELTFQVSCSYGPGRYDQNYEEKGFDYPLGFVRWTEQRNFEAVLDMIADCRLDVSPLISHRFPIESATEAYALITGSAPSLGIVLNYAGQQEISDIELRRPSVRLVDPPQVASDVTLGFIGSGNYATGVLLPAFKATGARLKTIASVGGVSGVHAGRKFGIEETTTETGSVFSDMALNTIVVATRHNSHAELVCRALHADKHVFVEKPIALNARELLDIERAYASALIRGKRLTLMVGFNRRFSPHVKKMKELLAEVKDPKVFLMTVNAGFIPSNHWTQDQAVGGGRITGEACHFVDLLRFLAGAPIHNYNVMSAFRSGDGKVLEDQVSVSLSFGDGSLGTIHYLANGHKSFPKERLEIFCGGRVLQLDNFRALGGFGWPSFKKMSLWRQDKGQKACAAAFVNSIQAGSGSPIPFDEIMEVGRVTVGIADKLRGETFAEQSAKA